MPRETTVFPVKNQQTEFQIEIFKTGFAVGMFTKDYHFPLKMNLDTGKKPVSRVSDWDFGTGFVVGWCRKIFTFLLKMIYGNVIRLPI